MFYSKKGIHIFVCCDWKPSCAKFEICIKQNTRGVAKKGVDIFDNTTYWILVNLTVTEDINSYDALKVLLNSDYLCD